MNRDQTASRRIELKKPLRHFRIVTLAVNVPVPLAASRLAELGAGVVKVEPPAGDPLGAVHCPEWYEEMAKRQKIVRLNLKDPKNRSRLDKYLKECDLLLTSSRPESLKRLSLGWKKLHANFPALSHVALVGHPAPRQGIAGHDLTYLAQLGLLSPPSMPKTLLADIASAERVFSTALILLLSRRRANTGSYVEVSIEEAAKAFAAPLHFGLTADGGVLGGGWPQYNLYRASDGWVAVSALEPAFAKRLQESLQLSTLDRKSLELALLAGTTAEWEKWALERDIPLAAVRSIDRSRELPPSTVKSN
jgi:alpha-methylacyl-CoA racemase